jgi:hypothetical protein
VVKKKLLFLGLDFKTTTTMTLLLALPFGQRNPRGYFYQTNSSLRLYNLDNLMIRLLRFNRAIHAMIVGSATKFLHSIPRFANGNILDSSRTVMFRHVYMKH